MQRIGWTNAALAAAFALTAMIAGIATMRDYRIGATGRSYFPGLYTAVLPTIQGIYGIMAILRAAHARRDAEPPQPSD